MRVRHLAAASLCLALTACASTPSSLPPRSPLAQWRPSPNFDQRHPALIVIHITEQGSVEESLRTLSNTATDRKVSAHYLIGGDGSIHQLVADDQRAWHAGAGSWGGMTDLNSSSIGIELDCEIDEPIAEAQFQSLLRLLDDLTTRLKIRKRAVIGHADLAPTRKTDPGPQFPWQRLAEAGYGRWPSGPLSDPPPGFDGWLALRAVGYPLADRGATLRAFRIHYRQRDDGENPAPVFEPEDLRILHALTASE